MYSALIILVIMTTISPPTNFIFLKISKLPKSKEKHNEYPFLLPWKFTLGKAKFHKKRST